MFKVNNVACITLLCLASILGGEARTIFAPRQFKSGTQAIYCNYDGQVFFSNTFNTFLETNVWGCKDSYAYSFSSRYIVLNLSNIQVSCNGFDNIELWDNTGKEWVYCRDGRPSSYTFVANGANWVGISRLGRVRFDVRISFTNTNPVVTTVAPVTNAPVTNVPSTGSCGVQAIKPDETGLKIVGGQIVVPNSWPWQAGFKSYGGFFCGGSLINDQWILTAAHCKNSVNGLTVYLGDHNIVVDNSGESRFGATKWINHPNYDDDAIENDIALVKLDRKVTYTDKISPICLPKGRQPVIGTNGVVTGWGLTQADGSGDISTYLRQAVIPINSDSVCGYGTLPRTQICAGIRSTVSPRDSCQGDSGGPFVMKDRSTNSYYLAGVVSYGVECGGRGAYTNVVEYENWISQTIANN